MGNLPETSATIKLINAAAENEIGLAISDTVKNKLTTSKVKTETWTDDIPSEVSFGDVLYKYTRQDTLSSTAEASSSVYGGLADSIRYTVIKTQGEVTSSVLGDTLKVLTNAEGTRSYNANSTKNTHTVAENLGAAGSGTLSVVGTKDTEYGDITTKLNADGHTLFDLSNVTTLNLSDLNIVNAKDETGSVLNVTNSNAVVNVSNSTIDSSNGTSGIYNDGTLNFTSGTKTTNVINTAITGNGTLGITGGVTNLYSSVEQSLLKLTGTGILRTQTTAQIIDAPVEIQDRAHLSVYAGSLKQDVINNVSNSLTGNGVGLHLRSGTLDVAVSGTGTTAIAGTVTANKSLGSNIKMNEGSVLNISADNVAGTITQYANLANNSTVNLSGGTLSQAIQQNQGMTVITGAVIVATGGSITTRKTINEGASLTINGDSAGDYSGSETDTNNGSLYLTGGTYNRVTNGSGTTYITGDVSFRKSGQDAGSQSVAQNVVVENGGALTASGTRFTGGTITVNDGANLNLTDGTLSRAVTGDGTTNITGNVTQNSAVSTKLNITNDGTLSVANLQNISKAAVTNDGVLNLSSPTTTNQTQQTLTTEINGSGTTNFSGTTYIEAAINQTMTAANNNIVVKKADYLGGDITGSDGGMELYSGILSHAIKNIRTTIGVNQKVTFGEGASLQSYLLLAANSELTANASQLSTQYHTNVIRSGAVLHLGDGTLYGDTSGNGTLDITGNVKMSNSSKTISTTNLTISEGGELTISATNLKSENITNNGIYNISGDLENTIGGTGTTKINNSVIFEEGSGISGTLDFNGGTLDTRNTKTLNYTDYKIGSAAGAGKWSVELNAKADDNGNLTSDTLTIENTSDAFITPDITLTNVESSALGKALVWQILKGGSGAQLTLPSTTGVAISLVTREEDFIKDFDDPYNVYFDTIYQVRDNTGSGTADISLSKTESDNDTLNLTLTDYSFDTKNVKAKDLFYDWIMYDQSEDKSFNFKTSSDTYNLTETYYIADITGNTTINGMNEEDTTKYSTLSFANASAITFNVRNGGNIEFNNVGITGFSSPSDYTTFINNGGKLNLNNVYMHNTSKHLYFNNYGTVDDITGIFDTNNGGIFLQNIKGSTTNNISGTFKNSSMWSSYIYNYSGGTINNITKSLFENIYYKYSASERSQSQLLNNSGIIGSITNTVFNNNYYIQSGAKKFVGGAISNAGTITNFQDNKFTGNYLTVYNGSTLGYGYGGAVYNTGTITNGITGTLTKYDDGTSSSTTEFSGNYINAAGGQGGALYNSGTIKTIDGVKFSGNYIKYNPNANQSGQGGALYLSGSITDGINNCVFDGNYVKMEQTSEVDNASTSIYGGAIFNTSKTALNITNTDFTNNYVDAGSVALSRAFGGAIYNTTSSTLTISGGNFKNNSNIGSTISYNRGGAILNGGNLTIKANDDGVLTKFVNNHADSNGGAIELAGTGETNINAYFENNSSGSGGAIASESPTNVIQTLSGQFINNSATSGGAYANIWAGHVETLSDATFTGNSATSQGGAIANNNYSAHKASKGFGTIDNTIFESNYASNTNTAYGGAICSTSLIQTIKNSTFTGNYTKSGNSWARGGAIYLSTTAISDGIYNTVFKDNYAQGKYSQGGAIYSEDVNFKIGAKDSGKTEFTGNYVTTDGTTKDYQAIHFNNGNGTLTLDASTNGTITFNDYITGVSGFKTAITGDGTGTLELFNNIANSKITADNILIDTVNNSIYDYNFLQLTSDDSAKYSIDVDLTNAKADNFTLGYGSSGSVVLDSLNIYGSTSKDNLVIQVLKNIRSDAELKLSKDTYGNYSVVSNFLESDIPDTVYNDSVYKQSAGIYLTTKESYHDSIGIASAETTYDPLNIIAGKTSDNKRNFIFNDNGNESVTYNLSTDIEKVTAGTLNIKGLEDKTSIIDANGHSMFNLDNETALNFSNVTVNNSGNDIISASNAYATVSLDNVILNGNITGDSNFKMYLTGTNDLNGQIKNATVYQNSGSLTFDIDTFAAAGTKLVANGGTINLKNDVIETYTVNNLSSDENAKWNIDLNLDKLTSDTIKINSDTALGTVMIDDINYIGSLTIDKVGRHDLKVLNTTSGSIGLALSDEILSKTFNLGEITRDETDTVNTITHFNTVYYNKYRHGILEGTLSVESDSRDSITINALKKWDTTATTTSLLGDTLSLVAKSDLAVRILQADSVNDTYNVNEDIGKLTAGTMSVKGVSSGTEASTINIANHQGFVLGKDTSLSLNDVNITGSSTPIEITDSSAKVELNNVSLSGGIKSDVNYNLSLIGNGTTTVNGTLSNSNTTLSQGGFKFNNDTFAAENTALNAAGGYIYMQDDEVNDYKINSLISNAAASYAIDVNMTDKTADTLTITSGSGVVSLDSVNIFGTAPEINKEYNIKVLNKNGNDVVISLSDALRSQMNDNYKLGACTSTIYDKINAATKWDDVYYKHYTSNIVYGRFDVNDAKDGISLVAKRIETLNDQKETMGDTLKLWNQAESTEDKTFDFSSAENTYTVSENLGTTAAGNLAVNGVKSGENISTIDANGKTLFDLANESKLKISDVKITNGRNSTGSIVNITNTNASAELNNVTVASVGDASGIYNAGTLDFTGGKNNINTGISGTSGTTNITGGAVVNFGGGASITQKEVNVTKGSLTLDDNGVIYGAVYIATEGTAKMSANAVKQDLANDGALNLTGGTLASKISGAGSTDITGSVTAVINSEIAQNINISKNAALTSSADYLKGAISNAAKLTLNAGTLNYEVTGNGTTTVSGNVISKSKISQGISITSEGSLTTSADNIGGDVNNSNNLNLTGGTLSKNISGSTTGKTNISSDITIAGAISDNEIHLNSGVMDLTSDNVDISNASALNVLSGGINLVNKEEETNKIKNTNLGNVILNGDLNLSIDADFESKTADSISGNSEIQANGHNIIIDKINLLTDATDKLPFTVSEADSNLRSAVKLTQDKIVLNGVDQSYNYLVSYKKSDGNLNVEIGDLYTAVHHSASSRNYTMYDSETVKQNLGTMAKGELAISGDEEKDIQINGAGYSGITVNNDNALSINNIEKISGFTTALTNEKGGTLNVNNVNLTGNTTDISNAGTLNFNGTNSLDTLTGTGAAEIKTGTTTINKTLNQASVTINESAGLTNEGSAEITTLTNNGTIDNSGILTIKGESTLGSVTNENGTLNTNGTITADKAIVQKEVNVQSGSLTNSDGITANVTTAANTELTNNGGITGNVTNSGTLNNNAKITGTLNNSSTVSSSADNFGGEVTNTGSLTLSGGTLSQALSGDGGATTITGDLIAANSISGNTLALNGHTVTLTDNGSLNLSGLTAEVNSAINAQNNNVDTMNLGAVILNGDLSLSIDADLKKQTADYISGTSLVANGHNIIIDSINVLADTTGAIPFTINVANETLRGTVKLTDGLVSVSGADTNKSYLVSYSNTDGNLNFDYGNLYTAVHNTANQRTYTMSVDEEVTKNLGTMEGENSTLTVNGGGNSVNGNSNQGVTVEEGQTLNINNVGTNYTVVDNEPVSGDFVAFKNADGDKKYAVINGSWNGFAGDSSIITNDGALTIKDVVFAKNTNSLKEDQTLYGGIISNNGTTDENAISGAFINNSIAGGDGIKGGTVFNSGNGAKIKNITADFISNSNAATSYTTGGMIYNNGTIDNISGKFYSNTAESQKDTYGGIIYNDETLGTISGVFASNRASASSETQDTGVKGGVLFNGGEITEINASFVNNAAESSSASSDYASGGAIYNFGTIENITGNFMNNSVNGTIASGGAIFTDKNITNITGNFSNNTATSDTNYAVGGAITNYGTLKLTDSNFTNNSVSGAKVAYGGAIFNSNILNLVSSAEGKTMNFSGNSVSSTSGVALGSDIYQSEETAQTNLTGAGNFAFSGDGYSIAGTGTITNNSTGTLFLNSDNSQYTGTYTQNAGTTQVSSGSKFFNGTSNILAGTLNWNTANDLTAGTLTVGSTDTAANLAVGDGTNQAVLTLDDNATIDNAASTVVNSNAVLTNAKDSTLSGTVEVKDGGKLANTSSLTLNNTLTNAGTVDNAGTLTVANGNNSNEIKGTGSTTISGAFTNTGKITQTTLTNSGTLTSDGAIAAAVTNSGTINNNSTITGAITNESKGTITSSATTLVGEIANAGTLNLSGGETQGVITNYNSTDGTIDLSGNLTANHSISGNILNLGTHKTTIGTGSLTLAGLTTEADSAIDAQNAAIDDISLGNVALNGDLKLAIDADLANKKADTISGSTSITSNGYSIIIDSINVLTDSTSEVPFTVTVADSNLMSAVKLATSLKSVTGVKAGKSYLVSYANNTGELTFEYGGLYSAVHQTASTRTYTLAADENVTQNLGTMKDGSDTLSIAGSGYSIIGNGHDGITVNDNNTLNISDVKNYTGFTTALTNEESGTINISNVKFTGNTTDISNAGVLTFSGTNVLNTIDGTTTAGSTAVSAGKTTINTSLTQKDLSVSSGAELVNNGTAVLETLNNSGTIDNNSSITGNVTNNKDAIIDNNGTITGAIDNAGTLNSNASNITGAITNTGIYNVEGGTNANTITGNGTMNILGDVVNNAEITQDNIIISGGKTLDNDSTINSSVTNNGTIDNDGALNISGGTNSGTITGDGTTNITGTVTNDGTITQSGVTVAKGGNFTTNLDNLITDDIKNSGTLNILGNKIDKNIGGTETGVVNINNDINISSTISGTGVALNNGTLTFADSANLSGVSNFIVNNGNMNLVNNRTESFNVGKTITMNGNLNFYADVDLANSSMDRLIAGALKGSGYIDVKGMNLLSDAKQPVTRILFANEALRNNVRTNIKTVSYSPIYTYGVTYDRADGNFVFTRGNGSSASGLYNPAVLVSPVASQVGGFTAMNETLGYAFEHLDYFSMLPSDVRLAAETGDKYAISENNDIPLQLNAMRSRSIWFQPYANFESIGLKNGPKVDMTSWGALAGGDGELKQLHNGWSTVTTAYIGYNGANQNYAGTSTMMNGGVIGATQTFYKKNFFTAITASAGASVGDSNTMYGHEDFSMLMAGVASKSGYNFEFKNGLFVIQPSMKAAYTFINTFDYTNAAGVRINSDPLHTIQLHPEVKFAANLKHGWQPYASVGVVWNLMNETKASANDVTLPEMSIKPYAQYGFGIQKFWSDDFSGYLQAMLRNGGRNGITLSAGFKWNIGRNNTGKSGHSVNTVQNNDNNEQLQTEKKLIKQMSEKQTAAMQRQGRTTSMTGRKAIIKAL